MYIDVYVKMIRICTQICFYNNYFFQIVDKVFVKELIGINNGLPRGLGVETAEFVIVEELREHNGNDDELEKGEKEVDNDRGGGDNTNEG